MIVIFVSLPLSAQEREWTDIDGRTLTAEFVEVTATGVKVKLKNGKETILNRSRLADGELAVAEQLQRKKGRSEFAAMVDGLATPVQVEAHQNSQIGLIGVIQVAIRDKEPIKSRLGSIIGYKEVWVFRGNKLEGVIANTTDARVAEKIDATGRHLGLPDIHSSYIGWEGNAWRIGMIRYRTAQGLMRTCPYFTASKEAAAAFYTTHGRPPKSDAVVTEAD